MYRVGQLIDERYRVTDVVGKGAHGVVYAAEDELLGTPVAVKVLNGDLSAEGSFKLRMHREARVMGKLAGTSATQIFAFNKVNDNELYIVMELLTGVDFETYLRDIESVRTANGRPSHIGMGRLVELLTPIAGTLDVAHSHGIIHRDLKPGNIFVLDSEVRGSVRLLDFGLAKDLKAQSMLTAEGMIAGSPGYIAPEVWRGRVNEIDHRVDVYSLGCVVFRSLTGQPPFDPHQPLDRLLLAVTRGERPAMTASRSDLPGALDEWARKALAINPEDRFSSVGKMWTALRGLAELPVSREPLVAPGSVPWNVEVDVDIDIEVESLRSSNLPTKIPPRPPLKKR